MKKYNVFLLLSLIALGFASCAKDSKDFDNRLYLNESAAVTEVLVKPGMAALSRTLNVGIPQPAATAVNATVGADMAALTTFKQNYHNSEAQPLPAENFELAGGELSIPAGNVKSTDVSLTFDNLGDLDRETVYVLPVSITTSSVEVLSTKRTMYYVFRGAALINVVADFEDNWLTVDWSNPNVVNNLSQMTMEALLYIRNTDNMISTVMGREGNFLIRLGDAGFPNNQIQIATSSGNFPSGDANKGLPKNEWVHIALTYDSADGSMKIYVNGNLQSEGTKNVGTVDMGVTGDRGFYIGYSYDSNRCLAGDMAEVRIWNVVRTQDQIASHFYDVDPSSEGLVAYWKIQDNNPFTVLDYSGNGNNAVAAEPLKWRSVSLPEPGK